MAENPLIVPGAEPFLFPGSLTGCLLIHGFTATPEEMLPLGHELARLGYTVLGQRLAGHATHPQALGRTEWGDWLVSVEEGLALLQHLVERVWLIGQSMGGMLALTAAARCAAHHPVAGVVALSTPFLSFSEGELRDARRQQRQFPLVHKENVEPHQQWGVRREADYPAYAALPPGIIVELSRLQAAMAEALPQVQVPALLIQSRNDEAIPPDSLEKISHRLGTQYKETIWLEGPGHSIVQDAQRDEVFEQIAAFIR